MLHRVYVKMTDNKDLNKLSKEQLIKIVDGTLRERQEFKLDLEKDKTEVKKELKKATQYIHETSKKLSKLDSNYETQLTKYKRGYRDAIIKFLRKKKINPAEFDKYLSKLGIKVNKIIDGGDFRKISEVRDERDRIQNLFNEMMNQIESEDN